MPGVETPLLDKAGAAEYLHTTLWHVEWLIRSRQIPFIRLGHQTRGKIRFRREALDTWLENNTVEAVD